MTIDEFFARHATNEGPLITIERRDAGGWLAVLTVYGDDLRELRATGTTVYEALRQLVISVENAQPGEPVGMRMWE